MPLPWRPLPDAITRRWASAAVVEALGEDDLARAFFAGSDAMLVGAECRAFRDALRRRPEPGGPGINYVGLLVERVVAHEHKLPDVPRDEPFVDFARVADHAGAIYVEGRRREQPRGCVDHYLSAFSALSMLTMAPATPGAVRSMQRPGSGRTGRPVPLEVRAVIRVILGLVHRCRPKRGAVTPAVGVALLLWLDGYRRPQHRDPVRPWPFLTPPNRFALRNARSTPAEREDLDVEERAEMLNAARGPWIDDGQAREEASGEWRDDAKDTGEWPYEGSYRNHDILPLLQESEPWIATAASMRRLAKAIQNLAASKDGEYQDYAKSRRG